MVSESKRSPLRALGVLSLAWLYGCAPLAPQTAPQDGAKRELLTPWRSISGAWRSVEPGAPATSVSGGDRIQLQYPIGVAARGNDVYIADAGLRQILRYDRARETLSVFAPFSGRTADQAVGLYVAGDQSLYVANPSEPGVMHFDRFGRVQRRFADEFNLNRPVAVAAIESRGEVWVADGLSNQIVAFSTFGRSLRLLDLGGDAPLRRLSAMSLGPDGLYLCDRAAHKVTVIAPEGGAGYELREGLVQPRAIAVDTGNRVFVADGADERIKVFDAGKLVASFGGGVAGGPSGYNQIAALAADENLLYVADSLGARVHILLVSPQR